MWIFILNNSKIKVNKIIYVTIELYKFKSLKGFLFALHHCSIFTFTSKTYTEIIYKQISCSQLAVKLVNKNNIWKIKKIRSSRFYRRY